MVYTEQFYVGYSDCGADMTLSNTALLRFFENIASMHGAAVGGASLICTGHWRSWEAAVTGAAGATSQRSMVRL